MSTIVGVATPPGEGGIAIVRLSGPEAWAICRRFFRPAGRRRLGAGRFFFGHLRDEAGRVIDEGILLLFRAPRSYTAEDVAEVQLHGGPAVVEEAFGLFRRAGARPAEPGEFTRRAFLNGRLDLAQAEAVAEMVAARSASARRLAWRNLEGGLSGRVRSLGRRVLVGLAGLEAALDFPEEVGAEESRAEAVAELDWIRAEIRSLLEGYEAGRRLREGLRVVLLGPPNAGKSTLLNALLGRERAITSPTPGTTRDLLEAELRVDGRLILLTDTAGLGGESADPVEAEGRRRARAAAGEADLVLWVTDGTGPVLPPPDGVGEVWGIRQKADLPNWTAGGGRTYRVSALTGEGISALRRDLAALGNGREEVLVANERQRLCLERAAAALERAAGGSEEPLEILAADLREAWEALGEITGESGPAEILDEIFGRFCLGK